MDQLSRVLERLSVSAGVFYSGKLCGLSAFDDPGSTTGHIHLLKTGQLTVKEKNKEPVVLTGPALLFYPRPYPHQITAEETDNVEIVCASVNFSSGAASPVAASLPPIICLQLDASDRINSAAQWLFEEAFGDHDARQTMMNRLCEVLVLELLRHVITSGNISSGLLAGLADTQLARVIDTIHQQPEKNWTLVELAEVAAMSRSRFAEHFKTVLGQTPGDYLTSWRIELAKGLLKKDKPVGFVANEVGYENASALARAFRKKTGFSPREWLDNSESR
ncbi:AraC family transcriptional regulator [Spongorhabdus nitratireducens]